MNNNTLPKRIVATAISIVTIICIAITIGVLFGYEHHGSTNYSESFSGFISQTQFSSKEETARTFVSEQLSGATAEPLYSEFKVISELSQAEIERLNATSPTPTRTPAPNIESGETCEITYFVSGDTHKVKADILRNRNGAYLYRVRLPEIGEQPTKAYMDSVLDGDNYLNCTSRSRISATMLNTYVTYMQTINFANDCAHFNQELPGFINELYLREGNDSLTVFMQNPMGDGDKNFYTLSEINSMLYKDGYKFDAYLTRGGKQVNINDLHSMSDVTDFAFMMPIDCSYFFKTSYGFSMPFNKFKDVCLALIGDDFVNEFNEFWHDYMVNFHADYYVSGGKLSRIELTLQMIYNKDLISMTIVTDYYDFGTTKVTIPHD